MWGESTIRRFRRACFTVFTLIITPVSGGLGATGTATQSLNASIYPIAKLSVPGSASLVPGGTKFAAFQTNVLVSYRARTTSSGGGSITVQVTSDFSPAGGPSASQGVLSYTCTSATIGAPCSGTQTASTTLQTPVLTLPASACTGGGGACSSADPNSVNLIFSLTDDPGYSTGTYSAQITFVISAT